MRSARSFTATAELLARAAARCIGREAGSMPEAKRGGFNIPRHLMQT